MIGALQYFLIVASERLRSLLNGEQFGDLVAPRLWSMMRFDPERKPQELIALHVAVFREEYATVLRIDALEDRPPLPLEDVVVARFDEFWEMQSLEDEWSYERYLPRVREEALAVVAGADVAKKMKEGQEHGLKWVGADRGKRGPA